MNRREALLASLGALPAVATGAMSAESPERANPYHMHYFKLVDGQRWSEVPAQEVYPGDTVVSVFWKEGGCLGVELLEVIGWPDGWLRCRSARNLLPPGAV